MHEFNALIGSFGSGYTRQGVEYMNMYAFYGFKHYTSWQKRGFSINH